MPNKIINSIALTVVLSAASIALGQDNNGRPNTNVPTPKPTTPANPPADSGSKADRQKERTDARQADRSKDDRELPGTLTKATDLIGMRVEDKDGKKIGDIRNLAVNAEHGHVRYAIVDNGNGTFYAIPSMAFHYERNQKRAVVNTSSDRMKDAPTFKPEGWDTIGDAKWGKVVYEFYGINRTPDMDKERPEFIPAGKVIGGKAESPRGDALGTVKDLTIDTDKHQVAYTVLEFGNNRLFAAPWEALNMKDGGKRVIVRGVDREDLKDAPGFSNGRWPTVKELGWKNDTNFDSRPPTWLYGYRQDNTDNNNNNNNSDKDRGAMGGWQTNSKYNELFRPKAVDHWKGTIVRTDSVTPLKGMDPGVAIVVKIEGKDNAVVHLGPDWFIRHQQDKFTDGEAIEVVGSKVDLDQKPVIMATQIRMQGRTMFLRNADGVPAWDAWQERK